VLVAVEGDLKCRSIKASRESLSAADEEEC
jgi:hypothetical protein